MEQLHAIRAGKTLLCSLSVLLALVAFSPAQEVNRGVGDPIDVSVGAVVHPEVNVVVTGQPAESAGSAHHASSFGPVRNQATSSKPASATSTPAASITGSRTASPAQRGPTPMPPPFTAVSSSNKLSRGAKPAVPAQKKHLALASGGGETTHSRFDSAASNSDSSKLNSSISSARLSRKTRKQHAASPMSAQHHSLGGSSSKGAPHSSAKLPKPTLAK